MYSIKLAIFQLKSATLGQCTRETWGGLAEGTNWLELARIIGDDDDDDWVFAEFVGAAIVWLLIDFPGHFG